MRSELPKTVHEIAGKPLILHILERVAEAFGAETQVAVVTGHGRELVEKVIGDTPLTTKLKISFIPQHEQRGTGHAARCAMESDWGAARVKEGAPVLVLPGDLPLIPAELLTALAPPLARGKLVRLLTCELADPTGYGRVLRKKNGNVHIKEERDASARERQVREVAVSIYLFEPDFLKKELARLKTGNEQGEYYLTDLIARAGSRAETLRWPAAEDLRGINDPWELAEAARLFNRRLLRAWALKGVRFDDPATTWLEADVELAEGVRVAPGASLRGRTRVGRGAVIGPHAVLKDTEVGANAAIKAGTIAEASRVGEGANVGPYAHLRPESDVGARAKIGNFVELKKARVGEETSVAHLSYLGDAEVGKRVNIGCGFVTCNFDGRVINGERKHRTVIEDDVFLGSDCQAIAPVRIGRGAYIASGSTITDDVEPEALAIARARQVTKPGYARRLKGK